ncbi:MAG: L-threonylcarbamoyladenylate synthase [Cyanobacteriota bacterium]|jgi:L-threonylcarbamoyladenylate synthase
MSIQSLPDILQCLQRREAVLFPTDTVPALAIHPSAALRIWDLKRRPADKPLILMGADLHQLRESLGVPWSLEWTLEAERVWPGAVTLVLPLAGSLVEALNPGGNSLGLRVPRCAMAQNLLRHSGPLATTSANPSGQPPARCEEDASILFPDLPRLGPLPWPTGSGVPSEVRAWTPHGWTILRTRPDAAN